MKTTLELPDDLLVAAKTLAASRRTTLRALVEHALRREIAPAATEGSDDDLIEIGPHGMPRLKRRGQAFITSAMIRDMQETEDI